MTNKEAIEYLKEAQSHIDLENGGYTQEVYDAIDMAAKVLEERLTGEWYYSCQNGWHCSICQHIVKDMPTVMGKANFDYCPNCGAKMKQEEENENNENNEM